MDIFSVEFNDFIYRWLPSKFTTQLNSITLFIDGYPVSLQPIFSGAINMSVDIIPLVKTYKKLCTNEIIWRQQQW